MTVVFDDEIVDNPWETPQHMATWPKQSGLAHYYGYNFVADIVHGYPDTLYIDANNNGILGYQFTAQDYPYGGARFDRTLSGYEFSSNTMPNKFAKVISSTSEWNTTNRTNRSFSATGRATTTSDGKAAHEIILYDPASGSSFYPTATAYARHALSFYYTSPSDTNVTIKMQTETGYWNEGSIFATFMAKAGTHYYTITQNATNSLSGKIRLDFLDSNGSNLNGNVVDLSMWNTATEITTTDMNMTVTLDASNNWAALFANLPRFDAETYAPIEYIAEELPVPGYTPTINMTGRAPSFTQGETVQNPYYSYSITNKLGDLRDIPVTKVWNDQDDKHGFRPDSITVELLCNGEETGRAIELNADNEWKGCFYDLLAYDDNGHEYQYTLKENKVIGYDDPEISGRQDLASGYTITNSIATTSVPVCKVWDDNDNAFGKRPDSVTVSLEADGNDTGKNITLSGANNWTGSFEDLPSYDEDGNEIFYTIKEIGIDGYDTDVEIEGATPFSVYSAESDTIHAGSDDSSPAEPSESRDDFDAQDIAPASYSARITGNSDIGYTLTNTLSKISIPVKKIWDADFSRVPSSLEINLYRNGELYASKTVNESTNWSCVFENVPTTGTYTVDESGIDSSTFDKTITGSAVSGFTITNTERLDIPVYKQWDDYNDADELRPNFVTVTLYANGKPTDKTLELSSSNRWSGAFEGLAKRSADGKEIDYTIKETLVDYYESEIVGSASDGFTITNSHQLLYTSRTVNKIWDDGNDVDGLRAPVTVHLLQDGVEYRTQVLNDANDWHATFDKLPIRDSAGIEHIYTVEEDVPEGYEASYSQSTTLDYKIGRRKPNSFNVGMQAR